MDINIKNIVILINEPYCLLSFIFLFAVVNLYQASKPANAMVDMGYIIACF